MNCCERNYRDKKIMLMSDVHKNRISNLKEFITDGKKIVDVGCGGFMPTILNVDYACDIFDASEFLKKQDWKGEFKVADVSKKLPYTDKEFDIAVCTEVIEHLNSKEDILNAFNELNRIAKEWIVTTPSAYDRDPDHKFHFGYNDDNLFEVIPKDLKNIVIRKGYYYYISNSVDKLCKMFKVVNPNVK